MCSLAAESAHNPYASGPNVSCPFSLSVLLKLYLLLRAAQLQAARPDAADAAAKKAAKEAAGSAAATKRRRQHNARGARLPRRVLIVILTCLSTLCALDSECIQSAAPDSREHLAAHLNGGIDRLAHQLGVHLALALLVALHDQHRGTPAAGTQASSGFEMLVI